MSSEKLKKEFELANARLEQICKEAEECGKEVEEKIFSLNREIGYLRGSLRTILNELAIHKAFK